MKYIIFVLSLILLGFTACRLTNPGSTDVNEAMLIIENYTEDIYYVTVEDGSLGPYNQQTIFPGQTFSQTWEADDEVFVLNNGQVLLRFYTANEPEEIAYLQLAVGYTNYFTFSSSNTYLEISNETSASAWYRVDEGEINFLSAGATGLASFGEIGFSAQVELFYTGYHVFSNTLQITLYPSETREFEIEPDAGAINLINNSLSDITEVYIAPQEDNYWGNNVLDYLLEPEESAWWTVEPGWWDIRVIDEWGASYDFLNNYIALDDTDIFTFRFSDDKSDQPATTKKHQQEAYFKISRKVEAKNIDN